MHARHPLPLSLALLTLLGCASSHATAAPPSSPSAPALLFPLKPSSAADDAPLDPTTRAQVIDTALKKIDEHYVDPAVAAKLDVSVRAHQSRGDYDHVTSSVALATLLSAHFYEVAHDKHLRIKYTPAASPPPPAPGAPDPAAQAAAEAADREDHRFTNGGFDRVERFPGNVGYVQFNRFAGPWMVGDTVMYALSFVADSDALIVDLRENDGGYSTMVALIASYLFDGWPVQLSGIYSRESGQIEQAWTSSFVPGKRFGKDKPLYVLTSAKTVSAAEALAYDLQAAKRATVVGETTVGGANPGNVFRVNDHFRMQIAEGRAVSPVTKTNWEGTGVKPDVPVAAALALALAKLLALKGLAGREASPEEQAEVAKATTDAQAELDRLARASRPRPWRPRSGL